MNRVQTIKKLIAEKEEELKGLRVELVDAHSNRFHMCKECGIKKQIKKYTLVDYQWYDENTGSPGGGFYKHGSYHLGCPTCGQYWKNKLDDDLAYEVMEACKEKVTQYDKD